MEPQTYQVAQEWAKTRRRLQGPKVPIVFTNGVYDILTAGHIAFLEWLEENCVDTANGRGSLVIGINSDESVRANKGVGRPINKADDRLTVLTALRFVDAVFVFDELTPLGLIKAIQPNVLAKGGDYMAANVIGAAEVTANCGMVAIGPYLEEYSTSKTIERAYRSEHRCERCGGTGDAVKSTGFPKDNNAYGCTDCCGKGYC